ncbi:hypothetical protein VB779_13765 [Haloarculaceae archaeon H-GB11]|nr:hypothetical protein [Haloarculaceae archaeon H-GB11]
MLGERAARGRVDTSERKTGGPRCGRPLLRGFERELGADVLFDRFLVDETARGGVEDGRADALDDDALVVALAFGVAREDVRVGADVVLTEVCRLPVADVTDFVGESPKIWSAFSSTAGSSSWVSSV